MGQAKADFHPKLFYRKLEKLLHQIDRGAPNTDSFARLTGDVDTGAGASGTARDHKDQRQCQCP